MKITVSLLTLTVEKPSQRKKKGSTRSMETTEPSKAKPISKPIIANIIRIVNK